MRLLNGNVLVKDIKQAEKKTASGLYMPTIAQETFVRSEVVGFDPEIPTLSEGDVVKVMANHAGHSYERDGEEHRIINVGAILEIED